MSTFKKPLMNPFVVVVIGFVLGVTSYWGYQKYQTAKQSSLLSYLMPAEVIEDPFEQMQTLQEQLFSDFAVPAQWGEGTGLNIREDQNFIYYEIAVPNMSEKNLQVLLKDGQLTVHGETKKSKESHGQNSFFSSVFRRSYPLPENADPNKAKIDYSKDKVTVKFPKAIPGETEPPAVVNEGLSV